MIPVRLAAEPPHFNREVRIRGLRWLRRRHASFPAPVPVGFNWGQRPHWRKAIPWLRKAYGAVCAYSSGNIHAVRGSNTVEHVNDKSTQPDLAYEWSNMLLVCGTMNGRKRTETILNPFTMQEETFHLNFFDGSISVNPLLDAGYQRLAVDTIRILKLNDPLNCEDRTTYFQDNRKGEITAARLRDHCPFVYFEAVRQRLIAPA